MAARWPITGRSTPKARRLAALWAAGHTMHITTEAGTDIAAPIGSDTVVIECGYATEPGKNAAFSDGEVSSRPLEGEAEGVIVIDGPGHRHRPAGNPDPGRGAGRHGRER